MKRNGDIRSLFQNAAKKAAAVALNPDPPPAPDQSIVEEHNQEEDRVQVEEIADPLPSPRKHHRHPPHQSRRCMTSIAFHMIQVKGYPLKIIMLMIKMQSIEHILILLPRPHT